MDSYLYVYNWYGLLNNQNSQGPLPLLVTKCSKHLFIRVYKHFVLTVCVSGSQINTADIFFLNQTKKFQKLHDRSLKRDQCQVMVGSRIQQICAFPVMPPTVVLAPVIFSEA